MTDTPVYILERRFDAPIALVWRSWTEADLLAKWYGPNVETIIHKLDVVPGGEWLNEMKMGDRSSYQKTQFIEVDEPNKLVCLMSNADAEWNITSNPMMPDWPKTLLTTVTFEEAGEGTKMRLEWTPHDASDAEITYFANAIEGLGKGWEAGMQILAQMLSDMQNGAG